MSIILNVHNDPCFEDESSSLTLKYRPVHFSEKSCSITELGTWLKQGRIFNHATIIHKIVKCSVVGVIWF